MRTIFESGVQIQLLELNNKHNAAKLFTISECIGEGASCVAYRASDENGIPVKLKLFCPRRAVPGTEAYEQLKQRCKDAFNQQISLLKSASTANISTSLSGLYHDAEDRLWSAASDIFGKTFDKLIVENSLAANLKIIRRIAESSKAYHEAGWLLLDLKPENILVIDSLGISGVNFFDFDSFIRTDEISSAIERKTPLLLSSSEHYSAPELLSGTVDLSRINVRADFYSIGAMLFEAVFGSAPRHIDCLPGKTYNFNGTGILADSARKITCFLHKTLTASVDERFDSDDELIASLDTVIRYTDSKKPHLSLSIPKPSEGFVGREPEEEKIISKIRSGVSPLFICGEGGMGKTQLILKTAEDFSSEFDFYFASYKGSIRDTILSVPLDNFDIESAGENAYEGIMQCLRNDCAPNSVLIIDSFDPGDGVNPEALLQDEDYADLTGLPLKIVFTTRSRFEAGECIDVGRLPDGDLCRMISDILPDDSGTAEKLVEAFSGHTLAVKIAASSIEQGKITLQKLVSSVDSEKSVNDRLCSVFKASRFDREEKRILTSAALFPARGISSDVLYSLLPEAEYQAANRLVKAGLLNFDVYSNTWIVHDLVRDAVISRKDTRPTADRVMPIKKKLAEAEKGPIPFSKRSQLNEIYGNIGRLPAGRRGAYIAAAAAAAVAAAFLILFLGRSGEKPLDPDLTLKILFDKEISDENLQHDKSIVARRLEALTGSRIQTSAEGDTLETVLPLSALGDYSTIDDAVRLFINRPMALYAIAYKNDSHLEYSFEYVDRKDILSVSTEYGAVPGYSLLDYGVDLGEKYYYLRITFDDRTSETLYDHLAVNRDVALRFDIENENYTYNRITLNLLFPAEERNTFYAVDSRINGKRQAECLEYSLETEELAGQLQFSYSVNPGELWENPDVYSAGKNQCRIEDLPKDYVILGYSPYAPSDVSDAEFASAEREFKDILDSLGTDYAFGFSTSDSRELMCAVETETMSLELAECLASYGSSFSVRELPNIAFNPGSYETSASVEQNPVTGGYELVFQFEDKGDEYDAAHRLEQATEKMLEQGISSIYLGKNSYDYFLRADVDHVISDGRLVFSSMPMFDIDVIGEEYIGLLSFFAHDRTSNNHLGYSMKTERFGSSAGKYGIKSGFAGDDEMMDLISERFPDVTAIRKLELNQLRFYLNYEFGDDLISETADSITAIWNEAGLAERFIDSAVFYPLASPETGESLSVHLEKFWILSDSGGMSCLYVCVGGRLDDCFEEAKSVFTSEKFLSTIGADVMSY